MMEGEGQPELSWEHELAVCDKFHLECESETDSVIWYWGEGERERGKREGG